MEKLSPTEEINAATKNIDELNTLEMMKAINDEDKKVALAVEKELPAIARAVSEIAAHMQQGGRLIYAGAGTSGRLGVLDASECPPTYGVPKGLVIGLMAGGNRAIIDAVEGAEDDAQAGSDDLAALTPSANDVAVGLSASGGAAYVLGFIEAAKQRGMATIGISCNPDSKLAAAAGISIAPVTGPEAIAGSTRMKAGTAQKLVLNMLSTGAMVKLGKVYGNRMVDMQATNIKLRARALRMVMQITDAKEAVAQKALDAAEGATKLAVLLVETQLEAAQGRALLEQHGGRLRQALRAAQEQG